MSKTWAILALIWTATAAGQFENPPNKLYEAEGRMVTFRVVPGDKTAKLFIIGKKAGEIDVNKDARLISVTALHEGKPEELRFTQSGDSYVISKFPNSRALTLNIKAEIRGKKEDVKVDLKKP